MDHLLTGTDAASSRAAFTRRVVVTLALLALAAAIWYTSEILLLIFAAVLLAVFLDFLAGKLADAIHIGHGWAFVIVTVGIAALLALAGCIAAPHIADQISDLVHSIPQAFTQARDYLQKRPWGQTLLQYLPAALASSHLTQYLTVGTEKLVYGIAGLFLIVVLGIYLGANPRLYERGLVKLFPNDRREEARHVFSEVAYTLRWWVIGQLVPMGLLGLATVIGLTLMHVHLAFTLGLFTAFMIFIPYIGSIIAFAVTVMVTSLQGGATVLSVGVLYLAIHIAEGYLVTPLVQRRAVYLPPGLTISSQVIMGLLAGFVGLALATPLTAGVLVLVKMLYLHETPEHHGH